MEEEGGGLRLSKRFKDKDGEVDYKSKAGTAWSHSYLNQKPWHPLSYPNQRRKWIAEQTHAERERRAEEVAREYAQEQEFFRQTSLISKKEKEKVEMMQAVSFMYVRPPGYNAESAKAAEITDERKMLEQSNPSDGPSAAMGMEVTSGVDQFKGEKKKVRPKDVFGRALPTEEEFDVLKNAPRLETGVAGRAKPFAVEIRNVKCVRCGTFGHQSGDRECPLKDAIMPNEERRLKRDDPLTAILANTDNSEPLKWELKQKPGISPPRGGFNPDDPNQQIVAEEIFDEYGGFLGDGVIPELLTNFSSSKPKKKKSSRKSKHKRHSSQSRRKFQVHEGGSDSFNDAEEISRSKKHKKKKQFSGTSSSDDLETDECPKRKHSYSPESSESDGQHRRHYSHSKSNRHPKSSQHKHNRACSSEDFDSDGQMRSIHRHAKSSKHHRSWNRHNHSDSLEYSDFHWHRRGDHHHHRHQHRHRHHHHKADS